ncbi:cobalamin-binding domain-containing protein [Tissierella sp. Yu-01]|uniref:cobalamin-binding domain-containing protein n=1 Tax=Tissierella sp. Yu-01 TaxID=3035694 RepID=UPI00240D8F66|nr:cobalamin-binding domain-containing protein [Tissierella sp. Yu-01]WFA10071.1 cobalamin-binding domain-containing protein [Tissierella sp. Yu-01]
MRILLIEPGYRNKYPPLGLMKISTYHKEKNDEVKFIKGNNKDIREEFWDRIYITTLFTFYWKKTIDTIRFYYKSVSNPSNIFVGGILATLLGEKLENEPGMEGITIIKGLLSEPGMLGSDGVIIDEITPDYDIIDVNKNDYLDYQYEVQNAYITSTTKGCVRKCEFCAVKTLEPNYCGYIDIKKHIMEIDDKFGERRNLMLMDNNILASNNLATIIDDLIELGFERGNKNYKKKSGNRTIKQTKYVDFNQGTDARLLTEEKMKQLARIEVKPLRIAFDHADEENVKIYIEAQKLAAKYKVKNLSNYILFNFEDEPIDLYNRLRINIDLNLEFASKGLETSIWSFPMKYMPLDGEHCIDRKYIGQHWNAKLLRGVQCVLNATHGVVGPKAGFFEHAFGSTYEEFIAILYMPEYYITKRKINSENRNIDRWKYLYYSLSNEERIEFIDLIKGNKFLKVDIKNDKIAELYECYFKK